MDFSIAFVFMLDAQTHEGPWMELQYSINVNMGDLRQ
jgi:hypothetical protein